MGKPNRANDFHHRSRDYKSKIEGKDVEVEILVECSTRKEAYEKEKEFISLYGRKDLNSGTLLNKTDGGGWLQGTVWNKERIKKYSDNAKKHNVLAKWQKEHGPAVKGKKLPQQKQNHIDDRVKKTKLAWKSKTQEEKNSQTRLFIHNNPSYRVQHCTYCRRDIRGASAFKRFHGENCKSNNLK